MEPWLEPLYDASEMREADAWAIGERGVPSLELMESAGAALAEAVREVAGEGPVRVVCGKGNNGGDGLVAARLLDGEEGRSAEAILLCGAEKLSADARANAERFAGVRVVDDPRSLPGVLEGSGAIVDAIFGTGFSGAPRSPYAEAIAAINRAEAPVVAADIASGVDGSTGEVEGAVALADVTVAFHAAKRGHLVAPGKWSAGELRVADIGIPEGCPVEPSGGAISSEVLEVLPPRLPWSTKFTAGKVAVVGGSPGLTGAPCLAARGAIRAGAGYVTAIVPAALEHVFEVKLTEVMSRGCPDRDGALCPSSLDRVLEACEGAGAVVLGPGIGSSEEAAELARLAALAVPAPLVLDADGLNAFGGRIAELAERTGPTVLTPHAGELARLLGAESGEVSSRRLRSAEEAAQRARATVVLKGDDTLVVGEGRFAVNRVSAPALATAGSGDVLAGALGALIARGLEPFPAACAGVIAHARAGRAAAGRLGAESVIATDVIDALPEGLRSGGDPDAM